MNANATGRMPPSLSPFTLGLLAHERVLVAQPEIVRARILARARALPIETLPAIPFPGVAPTRLRRLLYAAAAGIALTAGVAAAFQLVGFHLGFHLIDRPAPTLPVNTGTSPAMPLSPAETPAASTGIEPAMPKEAGSAATLPAAVPARVSGPSPRAAVTGKREGGLEELQLLSRARQSDARGDYAEVLTVVADHERSYPAGRLSEEREVLRVKALVGLGRASDSRHAAARFHRQFPRSVLLQKIDDLLTSLP